MLPSEADALERKAHSLYKAGSHEAALAAYTELAERLEGADDASNQEIAVRALANRASTLMALRRYEDAVAAYDALLARCGDDPARVVPGLYWKGRALNRLRRYAEAVAVWDDLIARFGDADDPEIRWCVGGALSGKGGIADWLGHHEEALEAYERSLPFLAAEDGRLAWVLDAKAGVLMKLRRSEEVVAVSDQLLVRFGDATDPAVQEYVSRALARKSSQLALHDHPDEAIVLSDALLERVSEATEGELLQHLADALQSKGLALFNGGRYEEALAAFELLFERCAEAESRLLRGIAGLALANKGEALAALGREDEAEAANVEMVARFGDEVLHALDTMMRQVDDAPEPGMRVMLAGILLKKAMILEQLERAGEAVPVLNDLIARFEDFDDDDDARIAAVVSMAREMRDDLDDDEAD